MAAPHEASFSMMKATKSIATVVFRVYLLFWLNIFGAKACSLWCAVCGIRVTRCYSMSSAEEKSSGDEAPKEVELFDELDRAEAGVNLIKGASHLQTECISCSKHVALWNHVESQA